MAGRISFILIEDALSHSDVIIKYLLNKKASSGFSRTYIRVENNLYVKRFPPQTLYLKVYNSEYVYKRAHTSIN